MLCFFILIKLLCWQHCYYQHLIQNPKPTTADPAKNERCVKCQHKVKILQRWVWVLIQQYNYIIILPRSYVAAFDCHFIVIFSYQIYHLSEASCVLHTTFWHYWYAEMPPLIKITMKSWKNICETGYVSLLLQNHRCLCVWQNVVWGGQHHTQNFMHLRLQRRTEGKTRKSTRKSPRRPTLGEDLKHWKWTYVQTSIIPKPLLWMAVLS